MHGSPQLASTQRSLIGTKVREAYRRLVAQGWSPWRGRLSQFRQDRH